MVAAGLSGLSGLSGLAGCGGRVSDRAINLVTAPRVQELLQRSAQKPEKAVVLLLDARSDEAIAAGHLPGARPLSIADVGLDRGRDRAMSRYDTIVVYGEHRSDTMATALTKRLMSLKYDDVYLYDGGVADWASRGLPIVGGPGPTAVVPTAPGAVEP